MRQSVFATGASLKELTVLSRTPYLKEKMLIS